MEINGMDEILNEGQWWAQGWKKTLLRQRQKNPWRSLPFISSSPFLALSSFETEGVDFSTTITANDFLEAFKIGSKLFSEDAFSDVV